MMFNGMIMDFLKREWTFCLVLEARMMSTINIIVDKLMI